MIERSIADYLNMVKSLKRKNIIQGSIVLFLCFLTLPLVMGWIPLVNFTEEEIEIQVYPDHIWMTGIYIYENPFPFPVTQGLSIPLPLDRKHPEPVQLSASIVSDDIIPLPLHYKLGKHRFAVTFHAKEKLKIQVRYYQHAPHNDAWYILTTTQAWNRPLLKGRYILSFNNNTTLNTSNFPLDMHPSGYYLFEREIFMPQRNWRFSWATIAR